jgi:hypothetical protein
MKRWFHLTLVCCVLLCLFLSLPQAVGLNHGLQIVGLRSYFDRGAESASDAPTVSVVRRMRFDPARAGSLRSLILNGEWTASNLGPPGSETHAPTEPIGPGELPVNGHAGNANQHLEHTLLPEFTGASHQFSRIGVSQQPLARGIAIQSYPRMPSYRLSTTPDSPGAHRRRIRGVCAQTPDR